MTSRVFTLLKVFLKYWHPDRLNVILDRMLRHVLLAQRQVRVFLARRRVRHIRRIAHEQRRVRSTFPSGKIVYFDLMFVYIFLQTVEGFCHFVAKCCEDKHFVMSRIVDEDAQRFHKMVS